MKKLVLSVIIILVAMSGFQCQELVGCKHFKKGAPLWRSSQAQILDTRSDSIDILEEHLFFDFHEINGTLIANAELFIEAKVDGINEISLDLLSLEVDSIVHNLNPLNYTYDGNHLEIEFDELLNTGDTYHFTVYYGGNPVTDVSGFGGFYFNSDYAYNIGVAFTDDPHNYGRVWFPCFDNFVERFTIEFNVLTDEDHAAYCNGEFLSRELIGVDSVITTWIMEEEIPSYLVSMGVSTYSHAELQLPSLSGLEIPAYLIAKPEDTTDMKNSFIHLPEAFAAFEDNFGLYQWNKVGYNLVPFNSGAMEHSTNIAYPLSLANGSLTYEGLMAHELAHQWWGDLVTCRSAEDMWLNEGMASYCVFLFYEYLEGFESYREKVKENHQDVILHAHESDGARLAISGIGHENTYGDHVYNKGADVAHNLRTYLGEDFEALMTEFLDLNSFKDISSEDLRDFLNANSDADINAFFEQWVFAPGYPEFGVNYFDVASNGDLFDIQVLVTQRLHYAPAFYTDVPMKVRAMDAELNFEDFDVVLEGETNELFLQTSIDPVMVFLNPLDELSQAVLSETIETTESGNVFMDDGQFRLELNEIGENNNLWLRVENHLSDPDPYEIDDEYNLSDDRFWRFRMLTDEDDIDIGGRIYYYGNELAGTFIDEKFFNEFESLTLNEDSLVLLYRKDASEEWMEADNYEVNTQGSNSNWSGYIRINDLRSGDYAWSYRWDSAVNIDEVAGSEPSLYYDGMSHAVISKLDWHLLSYEIIDARGAVVQSGGRTSLNLIPVKTLPLGTYIFRAIGDQGQSEVLKFAVSK